MRKVFKAVAWIVRVLLLLLVAAFAWGRLRPPAPAQTEALKRLQPAPAPAGHNAWATLWLQDYDVPIDRVDAVYAQERAHLQAWLAQLPADATAAPDYVPLAAQSFQKRPSLTADENQLLCSNRDEDCLAKVRAQAVPLHALLARQSARLASLQALTGDDALWDDLSISPQTPLPGFGTAMKLLLTAPALDFVEGRQAQALDAICTQAATVSRLHAHTNSLVGAMVAVAWMDGIERELAGMLAALPDDEAIPVACTQAFAPVVVADVSLCAPMRHEYDRAANAMAVVDPSRASHWATRLRLRLVVDPRGTRRLIAPTYAWACQRDVLAAQMSDRSLAATSMPPVRYDLFDAVSNTMGLILARIAPPDYAKYLQRNEDYAAGLRLMAWLLQHRSDTAGAAGWPHRLQQALPALQQGGNRHFAIDPDGRHVWMDYRAKRPGHEALVLPLGP